MSAHTDSRTSANIKSWAERSRKGDDLAECFIQSKAEIAELRAALDAADALLAEVVAVTEADDEMRYGLDFSDLIERIRALLKGGA